MLFRYFRFASVIQVLTQFSAPLLWGSPLCVFLFATLFKAVIPMEVYVAIGCCTFGVYTLDHVRELKSPTVDPQRLADFSLIYRFRVPLSWLSMLLLVLAFFLLYLVWMPEFLWLLIPLGFTILYYVLLPVSSHKLASLLSPAWISITVTVAVTALPIVLGSDIQWDNVLIFFFLCFQNVLLFHWIDSEADWRSGSPNFCLHMGTHSAVWILDVFALITLSWLGDLIYTNGWSSTLGIFLAMQLTLIGVRVLCEKYQPRFEYRFLSDVVFVYPAFLLLQ
jgi:hypothetical protein